jgi:ceramide glucosyltransferase
MARVTVALAIGVGILNDLQVLRDLWLLPLRDFCAFGIWIWSFASNSITWRGEKFLLRHGRLVRPTNVESVGKNPVSQKSAS